MGKNEVVKFFLIGFNRLISYIISTKLRDCNAEN
jgi:hypothetical protein